MPRWTVLQKSPKPFQKPWCRLHIAPDSIKEQFFHLKPVAIPAIRADLQEKPTRLALGVHWLRKLVRGMVLPEGYPHSVHPNFAAFTAWNFVQSVAGSAVGVLATQCLLVGLGNSGNGGSTMALSATLNWVLKDGIGNAGGVLFVALVGDRFDRDAKLYRFLAGVALNLATLLEIMVPLWPAAFLPLAAAANTCKSVSWMANSATRAHLQRHFSRADNLGDITGKAASVGTAAAVAGTGLGVLISTLGLTEGSSPETLVTNCLILAVPLIAVYMWANYRSCRLGVSPRLSLQRLDKITRPLASSLVGADGKLVPSVADQLNRYILDPTIIGQKERFLYYNRDSVSSIRFEPNVRSIASLLQGQTSKFYVEFFNNHGFMAAWSQDGRPAIWFNDEVTSEQMIVGVIALQIARVLKEKGSNDDWIKTLDKAVNILSNVGTERVLETMKERGWDITCLDIDRSPILIAPDKN
jgi:hypothetical protein